MNTTLSTVSAAEIVARQKFIEDTLSFIRKIPAEQGKHLRPPEVHSCHIKSEVEFILGDFTFRHYGVYTMFGGEDVQIWYHPGEGIKSDSTLVLDVQWWEVKKCDVRRFSPSTHWQDAIQVFIDHGKEEIARIDFQQKERKETAAALAQQQETERKNEQHRLDEARRLGF